MIEHRKQIKDITDFWKYVPNTSRLVCKCGKKAIVHGYCNDCWNVEGKNKYLAKFQDEAKKMRQGRKKVDDYLAKQEFKKATDFLRYEYPNL